MNKKKNWSFQKILFFLFLLNSLFAAIFMAAKYTVCIASPLFILMIRMIISGLILLGACYYNGCLLQINKKDIWLFIKTSLFLIYIAFVFEFYALQYLSAFMVTVSYTSLPLFTSFFEYYFENKRFSKTNIIGATMMVLSILYLILNSFQRENYTNCLTTLSNQTIIAYLALIISIAGGAYSWFLFKKLLKRGYSSTIINGYSMLIGGLMIALTWLIFDKSVSYELFQSPSIFYLLFLILIGNIALYNFYAYLTHHIPLSTITFASFLCPCIIAGINYSLGLFEGNIYHIILGLFFIIQGLRYFTRK